jgi:hypothetical protein
MKCLQPEGERLDISSSKIETSGVWHAYASSSSSFYNNDQIRLGDEVNLSL